MNKKKYTLGEEIFNAISHGAGALLSIAGCVILIVFSAIHGDAYSVVSSAIFGASLIILYTMSTLYHSITHVKAKKVFRILDHSTIFILIAGTYTPYTLVTLRGALGWTIFGIIWGTAVFGIVLNAISIERFKRISMVCYILMGWAIVAAARPLYQNLNKGGLILLVAGGVLYTVGIIFYAMKKYKYMHSVWHLFVVGGSVLHYFSVLLYVI
ncbi:MAG: hemolysin III family protein [Clostridiales bacterium]|nr:hemolysin III family protein [Clostridiales bacterium]